jgi:hypothetical protein
MIAQIALIAVAGVAFNGALYLLWIAAQQIIRDRRQRRDARLMAEASRAVHAAVGASHEAAELTAEQESEWKYIAARYPSLGKGVSR